MPDGNTIPDDLRAAFEEAIEIFDNWLDKDKEVDADLPNVLFAGQSHSVGEICQLAMQHSGTVPFKVYDDLYWLAQTCLDAENLGRRFSGPRDQTYPAAAECLNTLYSCRDRFFYGLITL